MTRLGAYAVAAGVSAPIFLVLCDPRDPLTEHDLRLAGVIAEPVVLLLPPETMVPAGLRGLLADRGHLVLNLCNTVGAAKPGSLMPVQPPEILFAPIHDLLVARMQRRQVSPRFPQPLGTTWAGIILSLTSAETIVCSMPGGGRQIDPDDLGLRSKQNRRPKSAWTMLVSVIACSGELSLDLPARAKKQKEVLAQALQAAFGIHEDPLPARRIDGAYKAAFLCRDERPVEERRRWLAEYSSKVRVR